ncbi:MAG: transposase family protein [Frankiaceae bacterium]
MHHHFADRDDPRGERCRRHQLLDIIGIAICAVISGAESGTAVGASGRAKHDGLAQLFRLPNGIPSHDTFRRVFCRWDPLAFPRGFAAWIAAERAPRVRARAAAPGQRLGRCRVYASTTLFSASTLAR